MYKKFWSIIVLVSFTGCAILTNKNRKTIIAPHLSYKFIIDKDTGCTINHLIFHYRHKKKSFEIHLPETGNYSFKFQKLYKNSIYFNINMAGPSAQGYELRFPIQNNTIKNPYIEYKNYGLSGDVVCYTRNEGNIIDFCKHDYGDSCFEIQRLPSPHDTFIVEYSLFRNKANRLTIKKNNVLLRNDINICFPNSILWYVPERDFGIICLSKNGMDTLKPYFSLHDNNLWYIDSVTNISEQKSRILNQELNPNVPNHFEGW